MKQTYQGLYTQRICVECQPLMQNSNQRIKARTKDISGNTEWHQEDVNVEMGMDDMTLSNTPISL